MSLLFAACFAASRCDDLRSGPRLRLQRVTCCCQLFCAGSPSHRLTVARRAAGEGRRGWWLVVWGSRGGVAGTGAGAGTRDDLEGLAGWEGGLGSGLEEGQGPGNERGSAAIGLLQSWKNKSLSFQNLDDQPRGSVLLVQGTSDASSSKAGSTRSSRAAKQRAQWSSSVEQCEAGVLGGLPANQTAPGARLAVLQTFEHGPGPRLPTPE